MTKNIDLLFWDPCLSPHKHYFFESLCNQPHVSSVRCVIPEYIPIHRANLGWSCDDFLHSKVDYILAKTPQCIPLRVTYDQQTCHILSGIGPTFVQKYALALAKTSHGRFFIYAEPRNHDGAIGTLRVVTSLCRENSLRKKILHIFAIGINGPQWYEKTLYPKQRISSFAYFSKPPKTGSLLTKTDAKTIGFIGRYEKSKGYHLFCRLAKYFDGKGYFAGSDRIKFVSYGVGSLPSNLSLSNLEQNHILPIDHVGYALSDFDLLLAPSTSSDDGWNMVVSESLLCGTPVLCTNKVGASILCREPLLSPFIASCEPRFDALLAAFLSALSKDYNRSDIASRAATVLSVDAASEYFVSTIISCI
jgi:glycosyltransferase involved in cell wall biosynthesis